MSVLFRLKCHDSSGAEMCGGGDGDGRRRCGKRRGRGGDGW
ncbi:unnamed protein product [Cuscuta europaea]|uniref:Uncharacterized protein n=1 Tax=Cuscuta europaea TaxID=41803 RepID=A0A9P0YSJ2_CUSEU|nr:unnamed protein product [Cuscuta europaea]